MYQRCMFILFADCQENGKIAYGENLYCAEHYNLIMSVQNDKDRI